LPVSTTTVPCQTYIKLTTTTPKKVTVYSTKTITRTRIDRIRTTSTSTVIYSTAGCTLPPYPPKHDQKIIGRFTPKTFPTSRGKQQYHPRRTPDRPAARRFPLVERSPGKSGDLYQLFSRVTDKQQDMATTTVTETTYTFNTTTTVILPTPTVTEIGKKSLAPSLLSDFANEISRRLYYHNHNVKPGVKNSKPQANSFRTPTPCTVCKGITIQKSTITAPTPTRTRTTRTWVTVWTTKTISIVYVPLCYLLNLNVLITRIDERRRV
jgi:hypothetical protein